MENKNIIKKNLSEALDVLEKFSKDEAVINKSEAAGKILVEAFRAGNKAISCGNGGSMCDAMHFAEELTGRFRNDRKSLPAIAISDPSYLTCAGNDYGFEKVFSRFVEGMGNKGDVLLAISTTGNSKNVVEAAHAAKLKGMKVIALTGKDGGKLSTLSDIEIRAPYSEYADRAQEIHIKIIHSLIQLVEAHEYS